MNTPTYNIRIGQKDIARVFLSIDANNSVVVDILYPNEGKIRFIYPENLAAGEVADFLNRKHGAGKFVLRKSKPVKPANYEVKFRVYMENFQKALKVSVPLK